MAHQVSLNDIHLQCNKDIECSSKVLNSYCDRNSTCICDRGYKYYSKFNKCIFSNHFHCNSVQQCANLDPRLTCIENYCTCKDRLARTDNYLCSAFRKYCYKGYRYNVETTDCVFVGDLTINQLENLDQSVEIFVIVLFFITSALFIASCINNYQNERREKLRRRIAQQQTMSLFAEQRRRIEDMGPITHLVSLESDSYRNGQTSHNSVRNGSRHFRSYQEMNFHKPIYDDLPPSYEECMKLEVDKVNNTNHPLTSIIENSNQQLSFIINEQNLNDQANNRQLDQCLTEDVNITTMIIII